MFSGKKKKNLHWLKVIIPKLKVSSIPTGMPRKLRDKSYFYDFLCSQVLEVIFQQLSFLKKLINLF